MNKYQTFFGEDPMPVIYIYPYYNRINSVPAGTSSVSDNLYAKMTALFHFDGNLTDSSPTANNTGATVGTVALDTNEKKFGTASAFFDGSGSYINYTTNTAYNFGFGDFTVEAWLKPTSLAGSGPNSVKYSTIINGLGTNNDGGGTWRWHFLFRNDGALVFENAPEQGAPNSYAAISEAGAIKVNQWQHVAVTRTGGVMRFFVDGVLINRTDTATTTGDTGSTGPLRIGRTLSSTTYDYRYTGYIDDVRICKTSRYVKAFTPPTTAFPNSSAVLLMHMEGANNGTSFVNDAGSVTLTRTGNVVTSTAQRKFGTTGAYFDGDGDYLASAITPAFGFSTGDFTMESWIYALDNTKGTQMIYDLRRDGQPASTPVPSIAMNSGILNYIIGNSTRISGGLLSTNTWHHIAVSRKGGVTRLFVNGVKKGNDYVGSEDFGTTNSIIIGEVGDFRTFNGFFNGYMDEMRIIKGEGAYWDNFTPSNIPFNTPTPSLLLQMDGADGSTTFTDANGVALNAFGNVKFSSETAKFGATSIKFDGAGDYLTTPVSTNYGFGLGDFTMEMWFNPINGGKATGALMDMRDPGNWQAVKPTVILGGNILYFSIAGAEKARSAVLADNTWHHVAWSRVAGVSKFFVNGVMVGSVADASNYGTSSDIVFGQVSEARTTWDGYYFGYMDEIRIMKGIGMYTENFTPPTSQF